MKNIKYILRTYKIMIKEHDWKALIACTIALPAICVIVLLYGEDFNE